MKRPKKAKPQPTAAAPDNEPVTVVCSPLSHQPIAPVAAAQALCGECRQPVWFSYSSAVALGKQEYVCVCTDCALRQMQAAQQRGEPLEIAPPTPLQRAEIAEVLGREGLGGDPFAAS